MGRRMVLTDLARERERSRSPHLYAYGPAMDKGAVSSLSTGSVTTAAPEPRLSGRQSIC